MPNVIINDIKVEVPENVTVLEAIRLSGGYPVSSTQPSEAYRIVQSGS